MENILIKNVNIVESGQTFVSDIFISKGLIESIDQSISPKPNTRVIHADGLFLMPGVIDTHVHFRDPGLTDKADFSSESMAAAAGGVTSVIDMPNTIPAAFTNALIDQKFDIAAQKSIVNYSFMIGVSGDNLDEIIKADISKIAAVKLFMGSSTGDMGVGDAGFIEELFAKSPLPIALHCEDDSIIAKNLEEAKQQYGDQIPPQAHPQIRSEEACYNSSAAAVELAKKTEARIHICHISTEKELSLFSQAAIENKKITAEVCTHHLAFNDQDYSTLGNLIKVNPSVKSSSDQSALWDALLSGRIDSIGSDHAPHTLDEKKKPYLSCPSGGPAVQFSLPFMLDRAAKGHISIERIVELMCHNPAKIFGIERRGHIREGYFADLVLVERNSPFRVQPEMIKSKCQWSSWEGTMFNSRILTTFVNGKIVYSKGVLGSCGAGMPLSFSREK